MMDFLQDIGLFDPTKAETGTPLYENMVLMVQRSNLSAKILTVGLVQNLNLNGWGPVDWVGRVLPEAKFENKTTLFFLIF